MGLKNYVTMFQSKDYVYSFIVTFLFTACNMITVNVAAFALALLCTSKVKGKNIYRAAFLAMIPIVILFLLAQKQIMRGMVEGAIK